MAGFRIDPLRAVQLGFGGQAGVIRTGRHRQAVGKRSRSAGIVPLVDAVGRRGFATPPNGRICGHGGGERRVGQREVDPAGLGDAAAAEGGDATAVAARASGGV